MKYSVLSVAFLVLVTLSSCSKEELETTDSMNVSSNSEYYFSTLVSKNNTAIENDILQLVNEYRARIGLNTLLVNTSIKVQAQQHSLYMVNENAMSHDLFFIRKANLSGSIAAVRVKENVGYGYNSAESVFNAWLNSESHKEVIEDQSFTYFNVSAEQNIEGEYYFTLLCTNQ